MQTATDMGSVAAEYSRRLMDREDALTRAREAAKYTVPSLVPPEGHSKGSKLYQPYQSVGSRGLNNLASKLLLALLPPNSAFFRLKIDKATIEKMGEDPEFKSDIEKRLSQFERSVMDDIEQKGDRVVIFEALKHLIVSGNVLVHDTDKDGLKLFHLDRYVVRRDPMGRPVEIIVKETFAFATLPDELKAAMIDPQKPASDEDEVDIYTCIRRNPDASPAKRWDVWQETGEGLEIPDSRGNYPEDDMPWLPLRFVRIDGEDYGRGYIEEYLGDLKSLEALSKAIVEGAAAAAKVLFLVRPNGTTRQKTLANASNGAILSGNADDISTLQLEKYADFRVARETMDNIEQRLNYAFLNRQSVQRSAERVTAEEIRYVAQDLEDSLGGFYSVLTLEWQLPYAQTRIKKLQSAGDIPKLPKEVQVSVVTGLEALGRGHDRNKLVGFVDTLAKLGGPEVIASFVNMGELAKRLGTADGIDTEGLIKSQEQITQEAEQRQKQEMLQAAVPNAVNQIGNNVNQGQPDG